MDVASNSINGRIIRILEAGTVRIGVVSVGESHLISSLADVLSNTLALAVVDKLC